MKLRRLGKRFRWTAWRPRFHPGFVCFGVYWRDGEDVAWLWKTVDVYVCLVPFFPLWLTVYYQRRSHG